MRDIAAETLQRPLAPEVGVRPGMLPKEVKILKDKNDKAVLTLPGFERPSGLKAEAIFGGRHPGGPVKRERALEPAIYAASALAGLFCCSTMHLVTVPVDVINTRMQVCVCVCVIVCVIVCVFVCVLVCVCLCVCVRVCV